MTHSHSPEENQPAQPSYNGMPEFSDYPQAPPESTPQPPSDVIWVSRILYGLSALSLLGAFLTPTTRDQVEDGLRDTYPDFSANEISSRADQYIIGAIVVSVVFAALYALLAWKIPQGAGWARITATVLLGLNLLFGLLALTAGGASLLTLLSLLISVVALVLLWRRSASAYFSEMAAIRRQSRSGPQPPMG